MMIKSNHLEQTDLLELLNSEGEADSEKTRAIGQHLHECLDCRKALDALAAQSGIWQKAPQHLGDRRISDSLSAVELGESGTREFRSTQPATTAEPEWKYPITELLDPPKHPEMMGRIGKYDVEREIGRGGMGVVLKAHDSELNRPLAIKILAPHLASHGTARKRFSQEAIAAAGVLHPNVIAVHGVNNEGKTPYIVMPYVAGPSLQSLVDQKGPLTEIEIVRIAKQIAAGLAAAHSQNLVHRDIKPANILVEEGVNRVLITDFGLARAEDDASLTRTGWLAGTPNYMSPEQTRGERPDQRSDLFSLGSSIYFLATGRLPFRSETPLGVLRRIQEDKPTPVREVNHQISQTLADTIEMLLQKDPEMRFQTAAQLHEILEKHLAYLHQPDISKPPRIKPLPTKKSRSPWIFVTATLATGLAIVAGLVFSGVINLRSPTNDLALLGTSSAPAEPVPTEASSPIDASPELGIAYLEAGNDRYRRGDLEGALAQFQKATEIKETAAEAHYNVGCIHAKNNLPEKAFASLRRAVGLGFVNANQFLKDEDLDSLREDNRYRELMDRIEVKQRAESILAEAIRIATEQKYDESEVLCRKALKLDPENEHIFVNLGYAIHQQGRLDEAKVWHQKSADSRRYKAVGNYNLACVSALQGDADQALAYLNTAIKHGLARELEMSLITADEDLATLREDQRYQTAIRKLQQQQSKFKKEIASIQFSKSRRSSTVSSIGSSEDLLQLNDDGKVSGVWEGEQKGNWVQLSAMRTIPGKDWKWGFISDFELSECSPQFHTASGNFAIERPAGTLKFKTSETKNAGTFEFSGNPSHRDKLNKMGIFDVPDALLFRLFFRQDDQQELNNLQALQKMQLEPATKRLLMIAGITAESVQDYLNHSLAIEDHTLFLTWHVEARLLVSYKEAGLDLNDHKNFINQRVPANLIKEYQEAGFDLEKQAKFIGWRVSVNSLKEYQNAGLEPNEYAEFINMRVPPSLLAAYQKADLDLEQHKVFIGWRIEPSLLQSYRKAGLSLDKNRDYINMRVTPDFLRSYTDAGLDLERHRVFIQNRVTPEFLKEYQDAGLDIMKHKEFIMRRVNPAEIRKLDD